MDSWFWILFCAPYQDAANVLETVVVRLAREKAKTRSMAWWLRAKKNAVKKTKKEMKCIKKVNEKMSAVNRRMQNMVDDFLVTAEAENTDPETAKIWTEIATMEVIEGLMNDLNLEENGVITVNQVETSCSSGSAAN